MRFTGSIRPLTSAYRPTNGATERLHMTLNSMLGKIITEAQRDWDTNVQGVMAAYRATVHDATGYSPNFLCAVGSFGHPLTWYEVDQKKPSMPTRTNS